MHRRRFLQGAAGGAAGFAALSACARRGAQPTRVDAPSGETRPAGEPEPPLGPLFSISLAEWSLHRALQKGEMTNLDFPAAARRDFGIDAVEYVNTFFMEQARDRAYLTDLRGRCESEGVESLLIMCDRLGELGNPHAGRRNEAVENHKPWAHAAKFLGCHSIRVNAASEGEYEEQQRFAADGLRKLTEFAAALDLNVIVENHGGLSSNGAWLAGVMRLVDHPRCGTLPDFGNFCLDWARRDQPDAWYDRYQGVAEMMPWARAVSAKSHEFDGAGEETQTDYRRMLAIVAGAGYRGRVGIEYEGETLHEREGILATKALLERVREELERETQAAG